MKYCKLGQTNLFTSKLGFGCSTIASLSNRHSTSEIKRTLLSAYDQGVNFYDTANIYGQGDSERLLGKLFSTRRESVIICSKGGLTLNVSQKLVRIIKPLIRPVLRRLKSARTKTIQTRKKLENSYFDPSYIQKCLLASLKRLRTEYLDIYLLHGVSADKSQNDKVFRLLQQAKKKGQIRYFGLSTALSEQALYCLENYEIDCLQVPVNFLQQDIINKVLPIANSKGIGVIAREPFANGTAIQNQVLEKLASKYQQPLNKIALRYLLKFDNCGTILTGMSCRKHLTENLSAVESSPLSEQDCKALESFNSSTLKQNKVIEKA